MSLPRLTAVALLGTWSATARAADACGARNAPAEMAQIEAVLANPIPAYLEGPTGMVRLRETLRCQSWYFTTAVHRAATPQEAARLHVVAGVVAFADTLDKGKIGPGATHFCAAQLADPDLLLEGLLPFHPMEAWWNAPCPTGEADFLGGPWVVDGHEMRAVPGNPTWRPYLLQSRRSNGKWTHSELVEPGAARPEVPWTVSSTPLALDVMEVPTEDVADIPPPTRIPKAPKEPAVRTPRPAPPERTDGAVATVPEPSLPTEPPPPRAPREGHGAPILGLSLAVVGGTTATLGGVFVWQATTYGPDKYSPLMDTTTWETYRDEQLAPRRDTGLALIGAGAAAVSASALTFVF